MYKMKSDINFSLTHEMLENAENERIHTSYAQEKAILECVSNGDIHALENTYYSLPTLSLIHILDYLTEVQVIVFC